MDIIFSQTHPGDSTSIDAYGTKVIGPGYYRQSKHTQTATYTVDSSTVATITLQGTLEETPSDNDWVDVDNTQWTSGATLTNTASFVGNFTWIRVKVTGFLAGEISVQYSHALP